MMEITIQLGFGVFIVIIIAVINANLHFMFSVVECVSCTLTIVNVIAGVSCLYTAASNLNCFLV